MERHARKTQELVLTGPLCDLLAQARCRDAVATPLELDVDRVRDVEAVIGGEIPDPWLAVVAAEIPALREGLELTLSQVAAHTKRAHQSPVQRDFVALGCGDGHLFYGFLRGRDADRIAIYNKERRSVSSDSIASWLASFLRLDDAGPADAPEFRVRLIRRVLPTDDGKVRVRHPKWGEGLVLAEHGEGPTRKVKAEFPGLGLKVVQARFLEFID